MLRRTAAALILVPLAIVIIAFAVANRQAVTVSFDPFNATAPAAVLSLPLFALIIAMLIVGVMVGGIAAWPGQSRWRRSARRLEREANELRARLAALEDGAAASGDIPRQSIPPPRLRLRPPVR